MRATPMSVVSFSRRCLVFHSLSMEDGHKEEWRAFTVEKNSRINTTVNLPVSA